MAHYTGPKARVNRRLGGVIFENNGAVKALDRKPHPPGMASQRPRKQSIYGESMQEKQKIKYYYGLSERHLRRLFKQAKNSTGNTGENLLLLCERRLDSVVRLAGFTKTRPQARQGVAHGHFLVNGVKTDIPSMQVSIGDVVHVKRRQNLTAIYHEFHENSEGESADWLAVDSEDQKITVIRLPDVQDITLPVDVGMVVELLSR